MISDSIKYQLDEIYPNLGFRHIITTMTAAIIINQM